MWPCTAVGLRPRVARVARGDPEGARKPSWRLPAWRASPSSGGQSHGTVFSRWLLLAVLVARKPAGIVAPDRWDAEQVFGNMTSNA